MSGISIIEENLLGKFVTFDSKHYGKNKRGRIDGITIRRNEETTLEIYFVDNNNQACEETHSVSSVTIESLSQLLTCQAKSWNKANTI